MNCEHTVFAIETWAILNKNKLKIEALFQKER